MRTPLPLVVLVLVSGAPAAPAEPAPPPTVSLEQALDMARRHAEAFLAAGERLEQAEALRDRAWAALLPVLTASGTYTHADKEIGFGDRVLQRQDYLSGGARARQPLLAVPAFYGLRAARSQVEATAHDVAQARTDLLFEVARAYYAALSADNLVGAARRAVATADEHLAATRARLAAGEAVQVDVTRARMSQVEAGAGLVRALNAREAALDLLAFLIGTEPPLAVVRPEARPAEPAREAAALAGEALAARRDLEAARQRIAAAEAKEDQARLAWLPTLSLTGDLRASQNTGWSGDPASWQVGLTLDWLLFDGGLRAAERRERASRLREALLDRSRLERSVRREIRQALRDLASARVTLDAAGESAQLARDNRVLVLKRYRAGLGRSIDLVDADDEQRRAEVAAVGEELALARARLALLRALGLDPLGGKP